MPEVLQHWATEQAQSRPDAVAVSMCGNDFSYADLERRSNQLAWTLKEAGCQPGDRVCFVIPKSPEAITSILGILKSGCIYVPVDTAWPAARVAKILHSCQPRCVLCDAPSAGLLRTSLTKAALSEAPVVGCVGSAEDAGSVLEWAFCYDDITTAPEGLLASGSTCQDSAYILFTSGSTGDPKGVVITHSNVIHFVEWAVRYFGMGPSDRVSGHSPLHFDLSTFDIFDALASGAQLHLAPPELNLLPNKLADFIRSSELTQWFSVPSALNYMAKFDVVKPDDFPALRRVLWCGEVFPTASLIYWMKRLPRVAFTNLYGPTEATIASSYYTVPRCPEDVTAPVPIGTACEGEELLVLDSSLRPMPKGEVGDLYIKGVGLSPGYWRDEEKTRAAFVPAPGGGEAGERMYKTGDLARVEGDGLVYFVGRADSQIKSRGYRIELGEIEAALSALGSLRESAVVAVSTDGFEGAAICCAYVPAPDAEVTPLHIRKALGRLLPAYMLPSRWMSYDSLPKNANGKIDRPKLKEGFQQHGAKTTNNS